MDSIREVYILEAEGSEIKPGDGDRKFVIVMV
jgi:hypothetical protein